MIRFLRYASAGLAIGAAPVAMTPTFAQQADQPEAIVCQLLDNCSDGAADSAAAKPRPVRRGEVRSFSLARPKSATEPAAAAPAASPARTAPAAKTASAAGRPRTPHGQYDLRVNFLTGSAEVDPRSQAQVHAFATALKDPRLSGRRVRIEGHTDSTGSAAKNQDLSQRRAQAIADLLTADGVDASRLDVRGYGSSRPLPGLRSTDGANRRVVAVLAS